jgi:hypothetical protein
MSHDNPNDPALREIASLLNDFWSKHDSGFIKRGDHAAATTALVLLRAYGFAIHSKITDEALVICQRCGRVRLQIATKDSGWIDHDRDRCAS